MGIPVLLDTNILINAFRRNPDALEFLSGRQYSFAISDVTIMEIFAGCNTVKKRKEFEKAMAYYAKAPLTGFVSQRAISLIKRYAVTAKSLFLPDLLIAATAIQYELPLKTMNRSDFEFIKEIKLL